MAGLQQIAATLDVSVAGGQRCLFGRAERTLLLLVALTCSQSPHAAVFDGESQSETPAHSDAAPMSISDHGMNMRGAYGPYRMSREASGTSWQPDNAIMEGPQEMSGPWMLMAHGTFTGVYTDQTGPRGKSQVFNESMLMFMGRRDIGANEISGELMVSLEPLDGARGYPLLFQTGETANGRDPLVDRQHPHNLLMEVAASYSRTLSNTASVFLYAGPVGEPALGPPAYMHRESSEDNPDAPLTHHWLDATHISFGVATLGIVWENWKLEASSFNGREPDEHRYSVQFRSFDSSSVRLSYNPTENLSLQVSTGRLASPEQLQPDTSVQRTTASLIYDRSIRSAHWQTTFAWGRNAPSSQVHTDGYLLESALRFRGRHTVFARYEHVVKDELFLPGQLFFGRPFLIQKVSLGTYSTLLSIDT